jgi:hypothetical protein
MENKEIQRMQMESGLGKRMHWEYTVPVVVVAIKEEKISGEGGYCHWHPNDQKIRERSTPS